MFTHVCILITPVQACITENLANSDGVNEVKLIANLRLSLRSIVAAAPREDPNQPVRAQHLSMSWAGCDSTCQSHTAVRE